MNFRAAANFIASIYSGGLPSHSYIHKVLYLCESCLIAEGKKRFSHVVNSDFIAIKKIRNRYVWILWI